MLHFNKNTIKYKYKKAESEDMFTIHVVNSVKGGCGKSTFCLFLENYLLKKKEEYENKMKKQKAEDELIYHDPIIVDLDLSGSSWYRNNKEFLRNKNVKFIGDLIDDFGRYIKKEYIFQINESITENDSSKGMEEIVLAERILEIVMADPEEAGKIKDEQLDLFENSICRLIEALEAKGKTDIILDMPPGYEDYTERIVKHLLFDLSSPLYKKYVIPGSNKTEYKVKFYMMSCIDGSMEGNAKYISDFYTKASYSAVVENLDKDEIYFIINDIQDAYKNFKNEVDSDYNTLKANVHNNLSKIYSFDISHLFVIKHLDSKSFDNVIEAILNGSNATKKYLNVMKSDIDVFDFIIKQIIKN